jgi:hypothetical protein
MAAASVAAQTPRRVGSRIFSVWFGHHLFGVNIGGGKINNPAVTLCCCRRLTARPRLPAHRTLRKILAIGFKAWDMCETFDYMPSQYITFRWE